MEHGIELGVRLRGSLSVCLYKGLFRYVSVFRIPEGAQVPDRTAVTRAPL